MVLLSIKKIRERENEMLIRAKNSLQSKRVAASENELETMLRSMEKQVNFRKVFHDSFHSPIVKLFTKLKWKESWMGNRYWWRLLGTFLSHILRRFSENSRWNWIANGRWKLKAQSNVVTIARLWQRKQHETIFAREAVQELNRWACKSEATSHGSSKAGKTFISFHDYDWRFSFPNELHT